MSANRIRMTLLAAIAFAVVFLAVAAVSVCWLSFTLLPVCFLAVIETAMAVCLHRAQLWVHGVLIILEIIAGIASKTIGLVFLCLVVYVAATLAMQMIFRGRAKQKA